MLTTHESIFDLISNATPEQLVTAAKEDLGILNAIDLRRYERPLSTMRFSSPETAILTLNAHSDAILKAAWNRDDKPSSAERRLELFEAATAVAVESLHRIHELPALAFRQFGDYYKKIIEAKLERNWRRLESTLEEERADPQVVARAKESHKMFLQVVTDRFGVDLSAINLPKFDSDTAYGDA